jgi:hypothetical protein
MSTTINLLELLAGGGLVVGSDAFAVARADLSQQLWANVKQRLARHVGKQEQEIIAVLDQGQHVHLDDALRLLASLPVNELREALDYGEALGLQAQSRIVGSAFNQSSVNAGRDIVGGDQVKGASRD